MDFIWLIFGISCVFFNGFFLFVDKFGLLIVVVFVVICNVRVNWSWKFFLVCWKFIFFEGLIYVFYVVFLVEFFCMEVMLGFFDIEFVVFLLDVWESIWVRVNMYFKVDGL